MKIDHVALFCRDLEAMRQFFLDHFEAVSNEQYHNLRTGLRTYILSFPDGGAKLELMQRSDTVEVGSIVASTDKIAVAVVVVATAAVRRGLNQITKTCPTDADVVGTIGGMMMLSLPMSRETPAVVSRCLLLITAPLNPREAKAPPDTSGRKWRRLRPTMKYQMLTWYFV